MKKAFEMILERLEENKSIIPVNRVLDDIIKDKPKELGQLIAYDNSIKIVQEVAEEYNGGWIACSERLPDVEADVLLSLRSIDIHTGFRSNTEGYFYVDGEGYVEFENVLAWQPLPEPFKERD